MAQYSNSRTLAPVPLQPRQNVIIVPARHPAVKNRSAFKFVGGCQVLIGMVCAVLGVVLNLETFGGSTSNTGIGFGILYVITGILALSTASQPTNCNVIGGMVLSIISALSAGVSAAMAAIVLASVSGRSYGYGMDSVVAIIGTLCVLCSIEFIVAIVHSAYCCQGSCCATRNQRPTIMQRMNAPMQHVPPPYYVSSPDSKQATPQNNGAAV